jgi:hypothetical protein
MPCVALEITTFALGTTAPDGSRTTPEIPATPPADCAKHDAAQIKRNATVKLNLTAFKRIAKPLSAYISIPNRISDLYYNRARKKAVFDVKIETQFNSRFWKVFLPFLEEKEAEM